MTCFHTSPPSPAAANFSATILRMVYVAGLRRLEWTSLCKTRIAFTFLIARSLLCRSAAISPSASRASGESMSAPSGSSCPGVSMAVKGLPRSPNQLRLAYDVFLVHDSLPASVEKRGPSSSSPLPPPAPPAGGAAGAAAGSGVFEALRWAEAQHAAGARCVLVADVEAAARGGEAAECVPALADRLYRAASGVRAELVASPGTGGAVAVWLLPPEASV
mmetsp:Transcript_2170/g.7594  ORF Transcript_2170/g.7594 Transcript_2170/m.7594 type:complete len:219 (+) Transcript_2170:898-1554(+)